MNDRPPIANVVDPTWPPLVSCWTSAVNRAAETASQMQGPSATALDTKSLRREWFDLWANAIESYLRSPDFLKVLKGHIDTLIAAKRANDSHPLGTPGQTGRLSEDVQALSLSFEDFLRDAELSAQHSFVETGDTAGGTAGDAATSDAPTIDRLGAGPTAKPPRSADRSPKWATTSEVVYEEAPLRLLHFSPAAVKFAEPILVCFALVNRPYILDLKENRSVVRRLLDRGFDVYLIDWGIPDESDASLGLENYVHSMLNQVIDVVCERAKTQQLNLLGYCMGGTMCTMYTALHPDRIRNLILMAAPIDFADNNGLLNLWARPETFDVDGLIDAFGNCPGEFLQFVFQLMRPVQNFAEKQLSYVEHFTDAEFLDDFEAIERWSNDGIPVAGATFREFVTLLYQENRLVRDQLCLAGKKIRLSEISCPILLLVAEKDHLVPPRSTLALEDLVSSRDVKALSIPAGHIGLAVGSRAQRELWPTAADWIAKHSTDI